MDMTNNSSSSWTRHASWGTKMPMHTPDQKHKLSRCWAGWALVDINPQEVEFVRHINCGISIVFNKQHRLFSTIWPHPRNDVVFFVWLHFQDKKNSTELLQYSLERTIATIAPRDCEVAFNNGGSGSQWFMLRSFVECWFYKIYTASMSCNVADDSLTTFLKQQSFTAAQQEWWLFLGEYSSQNYFPATQLITSQQLKAGWQHWLTTTTVGVWQFTCLQGFWMPLGGANRWRFAWSCYQQHTFLRLFYSLDKNCGWNDSYICWASNFEDI